MKKLYRYLLEIKLIFKYIGILEICIILGVLLGGDIYLNIYSNLNWGGDEDNYYFIIDYFFEIVNKVISWAF